MNCFVATGILACLMSTMNVLGQCIYIQKDIEQHNIDLRGQTVVLDSITITVDNGGVIILDFEGYCISSPGDKIFLAASHVPMWFFTYGHTEVEAYSSDVDRYPFVHARALSITPGTYTFYAVGQNFDEMDGTGLATINATFLLRFYENGGPGFFLHHGTLEEDENIRDSIVAMHYNGFGPMPDGKIYLRWTGFSRSDPGDLNWLATSDTIAWAQGDGRRQIRAISTDINTTNFSYTNVLDLDTGYQIFYQYAQNVFDTLGNGELSVYSGVSHYWMPDTAQWNIDQVLISLNSTYIRGNPVALDSVTINSVYGGTAFVTFDGHCIGDPGDRIHAAVSEDHQWHPGAGHVEFEPVPDNNGMNSFTHTRAFTVPPGGKTFYAVVENAVEMDGTGTVDITGHLSYFFCPNPISGLEDRSNISEKILIFPNPVSELLHFRINAKGTSRFAVKIVDQKGNLIKSLTALPNQNQIVSVAHLASGAYHLLIRNGEKRGSAMFIIE